MELALKERVGNFRSTQHYVRLVCAHQEADGACVNILLLLLLLLFSSIFRWSRFYAFAVQVHVSRLR